MIGFVASAGDPLRRGLVGWYRMLGNANDSSGRSNSGTLVASPTAAADKYGNTNSAYTLNGSSQYVSLSQTSGLPLFSHTTPYSISMWVKGAAQTGKFLYTEGFSGGGNSLFGVSTSPTNSSKIRPFMRTSENSERLNVTSNTTVFDDAWHHIAWTDNAGTAKMYIDSVQDTANFNYTTAALGTVDRCTIGAVVRATVGNYFNGSVSDVRLYNRALTADEVGTLYRATQRI